MVISCFRGFWCFWQNLRFVHINVNVWPLCYIVSVFVFLKNWKRCKKHVWILKIESPKIYTSALIYMVISCFSCFWCVFTHAIFSCFWAVFDVFLRGFVMLSVLYMMFSVKYPLKSWSVFTLVLMVFVKNAKNDDFWPVFHVFLSVLSVCEHVILL